MVKIVDPPGLAGNVLRGDGFSDGLRRRLKGHDKDRFADPHRGVSPAIERLQQARIEHLDCHHGVVDGRQVRRYVLSG